MHYVINVALNGQHFFATDARSIHTLSKAETVFEEICKRFPAEEGFHVTCSEWRNEGRTLRSRAQA